MNKFKKFFIFLCFSFLATSLFAVDYTVSKEEFVSYMNKQIPNVTTVFDFKVFAKSTDFVTIKGYSQTADNKIYSKFRVNSLAFLSSYVEENLGYKMDGEYEVKVPDASNIKACKTMPQIFDALEDTTILVKTPSRAEFKDVSGDIYGLLNMAMGSSQELTEAFDKMNLNDADVEKSLREKYDGLEFKNNSYVEALYKDLEKTEKIGTVRYTFQDKKLSNLNFSFDFPLEDPSLGLDTISFSFNIRYSKVGSTKVTKF